jgi:hypothetical protein
MRRADACSGLRLVTNYEVSAEEAFSPEDEAFFQGAAADAADSVRPVTLDGHEALEEEDDAGALPRTSHPGRFVRPVRRVVAVLAALSAAALAREALRSPADELAVAPAQLASNATPALDTDALGDDLTCSPAQTGITSADSTASPTLEPPVAFIGPPAPPVVAAPEAPAPAPRVTAHGHPRVKSPVKVAMSTARTAPTKVPARTKSLSTAALLHAVRAQHAKGPPRK